MDSVVLAQVTRGAHVESEHRGSLVVVKAGKVLHAFGDVERKVFCRSAVKPLQALPLLEAGLHLRYGLDDRELAVMCASHTGTAAHVGVVEGLLAKGGFSEEELLCGPHAPGDAQSADAMVRAGLRPRRVHNNCSGKHAGFLMLAKSMGVPLLSHLDPRSSSQLLVKQVVAEMAEVKPSEVDVEIDGCGAPTMRLPLVGLARAFASLVRPDALPPARAEACRRLFAAVSREPFYTSGSGRLPLALMEALPGRIWAKNGAEGVFAVGLPGGVGLAVKVDDGADRGYHGPVIEALLALGALTEVPAGLEPYRLAPVYNTQGKHAGDVKSALRFDQR